MIVELKKLFDRDLTHLKQEIESFDQQEHLWETCGAVKNPAGNLCLHLVGNLQAFIGHNLGNVPYQRNREAEFTTRGLSREDLCEQIDSTRAVVLAALDALSNADLEKTYVQEVFGFKMTNGYFLIHLATHLSYHLGQINYLRRILEP